MEIENERTNSLPLLFPDLSYRFQGACFQVRKDIGGGHKETIYQRALSDEMARQGIPFQEQPKIRAIHPTSNKLLGYYQPDFLIDNKFLVEIKALPSLTTRAVRQLYDYLRVSKYELGYLVNFCSKTCVTQRLILTNDRKQKAGI